MEFDYKYLTFDELNVPRILYKYRSWNNNYHKTLLTRREVYMASPLLFEDEKDARMSRERFQFTEDIVRNEYYNIVMKVRPESSIEELISKANQMTDITNLETVSDDMVEYYRTLDSKLGILSLTYTNNNLQLWNYYAESGNGFCVGIDTKYICPLTNRGANVSYFDKLPEIKLQEETNVQIYKHVFCKEQKWSFEQEYRVYLYKENGLNEASRTIRLPKEAIIEVVFGFNMDSTTVQKIKNVCNSTGLTPKFLKATIFGDKVAITEI